MGDTILHAGVAAYGYYSGSWTGATIMGIMCNLIVSDVTWKFVQEMTGGTGNSSFFSSVAFFLWNMKVQDVQCENAFKNIKVSLSKISPSV